MSHRKLLVSRIALVAALGAATEASPQVIELPARDVALRPALDSVYRVGKVDGARWELYGSLVEVAFDGTGNLHVFDRLNARVVVVGTNGRLIREVGVRGDGPGELRDAVGFAVMRDGTIAIADIGQRAFLLFSNTGAFQRSVAFGSDALTSLGVLHADPRGGSVISVGQTMVMMQAGGEGPITRMRGVAAEAYGEGRPIARYSLAAGGQRRLVHIAWQPTKPQPAQAAAPTPGVLALGQRAFEPRLYAAVLPSGAIVVSDSSTYSLDVISADGVVRPMLRRPIRPQPVTAAMQRAERSRRLSELTASGGLVMSGRAGGAGPSPEQVQQMMQQRIEQLEFYPELPVVTGLAAGWTGKIWIGRAAAGGAGDGPVDVLSAAGDYIGTIASGGERIPNAFGPNGLVAYVERDALDVVYVAVRRLPTELR